MIGHISWVFFFVFFNLFIQLWANIHKAHYSPTLILKNPNLLNLFGYFIHFDILSDMGKISMDVFTKIMVKRKLYKI